MINVGRIEINIADSFKLFFTYCILSKKFLHDVKEVILTKKKAAL